MITNNKKQTVILSGIKNSGVPHIGNYLGFYLSLARLYEKRVKGSDEFALNLFMPDLHSLTIPREADEYKDMVDQSLMAVKFYAAAGIDFSDENVIIYRQSRVSAHSELTIILNNFTGFGELSRQTQFKDQQQKGEDVTVGLFNYPVLMAADILLYGPKYVPVGEDQRQHIELTRDVAGRFNSKFGKTFEVPESFEKQVAFAGQEEPVRIMSLSNPNNKMSKSVTDPKGTIDLTDSPEVARKKIMAAETDSLANITLDRKNQPGIYNLLQMLAIFTDTKLKEVAAKYEGSEKYGDLKKDVADVICDFLVDIQDKLRKFSDEDVLRELERGESVAECVANNTLYEVQKKIGLMHPKTDITQRA